MSFHPQRTQYVTPVYCRPIDTERSGRSRSADVWVAVAKARLANGDAAGAVRAKQAARDYRDINLLATDAGRIKLAARLGVSPTLFKMEAA